MPMWLVLLLITVCTVVILCVLCCCFAYAVAKGGQKDKRKGLYEVDDAEVPIELDMIQLQEKIKLGTLSGEEIEAYQRY